jgi:hypothetical protein
LEWLSADEFLAGLAGVAVSGRRRRFARPGPRRWSPAG